MVLFSIIILFNYIYHIKQVIRTIPFKWSEYMYSNQMTCRKMFLSLRYSYSLLVDRKLIEKNLYSLFSESLT